jgi:hypothetical protein
MKPEDVYISPQGEVLVTNFTMYLTDHEFAKIWKPGVDGIPKTYRLEVGKWYKLGQKAPAPPDDFIDVIHPDGKIIPHKPKYFMSKSEWREKQLNQVIQL